MTCRCMSGGSGELRRRRRAARAWEISFLARLSISAHSNKSLSGSTDVGPHLHEHDCCGVIRGRRCSQFLGLADGPSLTHAYLRFGESVCEFLDYADAAVITLGEDEIDDVMNPGISGHRRHCDHASSVMTWVELLNVYHVQP